jgi:hypothetical protein
MSFFFPFTKLENRKAKQFLSEREELVLVEGGGERVWEGKYSPNTV